MPHNPESANRNTRNAAKVEADEPALGWIKHLHEVGTVRSYALREAEILREIADVKERIKNLRTAHANLIKEAEAAVARDWSAGEVAAAEHFEAEADKRKQDDNALTEIKIGDGVDRRFDEFKIPPRR
jgi:hypothetical protein